MLARHPPSTDNFDLLINRVQPIRILASPFRHQRHRSLTTKQRLIYAVIKNRASTLVFLHCARYIYAMYCQVYFLANTTVVGSFFSLTIPLHFPFQLPTELRWFCFAYRSCSSSSSLLYAYARYSLSLSAFLSTRLLSISKQETFRVYTSQHPSWDRGHLPLLIVVRGGTHSGHTYEYDCSPRLYRLGAIVNFWFRGYTGHRVCVSKRDDVNALYTAVVSTVIPGSVFRPGYRKAWIWIFSRDWFSQEFRIREQEACDRINGYE